MKSWFSILVICTICVFACERETRGPVSPGEPTLDDLVFENCLVVQAAAEAFADESGGEYSDYVEALTDFLPDSTLLTNPVTGGATEPVWMEPNGVGSTSYRGFSLYDVQWNMRCVGYLIVGRGEKKTSSSPTCPTA